jgi:hypothetical protein
MHNLMGKKIAVDTEMTMTCGTLVATAYAHSLGVTLGGVPLIFRGNRWEMDTASKASRAPRGSAPGNLHPVDQGEQVMIGTRQMSRQDQSESTGRALRGKITHFAVASRAEIASSRGF